MIFERRVTVVGEAPTHAMQLPLSGRIGIRFRALAGIKDDTEMRSLFDCVNLFDTPQSRWSSDAANVRATTIGICSQAEMMVLLGARVGAAFYMRPFKPNCLPGLLPGFNRSILGVVVPKPSARDDESVRAKTSHVLRLAVRVARGEELRDLLCTEHGAERVHAPEIREERRVYECGCEVLA